MIHDAPDSLIKSRKRCRCESSDHERHKEKTPDDIVVSMKSITVLQAQVSYLQLLLREYLPSPFSTLAEHRCPVNGCGCRSSRLDYMQKHIRQSTDPAHQTVAAIINETHCVHCFQSWNRPTDLVRHEKYHLNDSYISRLDKVSGISQRASPFPSRPLSPPSSVSVDSDRSFNW